MQDRAKHGGLYCSNRCQQDYATERRLEAWRLGLQIPTTNKSLRLLAGRAHGAKCSVCEIEDWMGKPITLDVEHKNGNPEDNSFDNIALICPNCHSQTPTYKGRNKGNGRHFRRMRHREGKSF